MYCCFIHDIKTGIIKNYTTNLSACIVLINIETWKSGLWDELSMDKLIEIHLNQN